jgi:hypothetical protein
MRTYAMQSFVMGLAAAALSPGYGSMKRSHIISLLILKI